MAREQTTTEGTSESLQLTPTEARRIISTSLKNRFGSLILEDVRGGKTPEERAQVYQEIADDICKFDLPEHTTQDLVWVMVSYEAPLRMSSLMRDFCQEHELAELGKMYPESETEPDALGKVVELFPEEIALSVRIQSIFPVRTDQWLEPLLLKRELGFDPEKQRQETASVLTSYLLYGNHLFSPRLYHMGLDEENLRRETNQVARIIVDEWELPAEFTKKLVHEALDELLKDWLTKKRDIPDLLEFAKLGQRAAQITDIREIDWSRFGEEELAIIFLSTIEPFKEHFDLTRWIRDFDSSLVYYFSGLKEWIKLTGVDKEKLVDELLEGLSIHQATEIFTGLKLIERFVEKKKLREKKLELFEKVWANRFFEPLTSEIKAVLVYLAMGLGEESLVEEVNHWSRYKKKPELEELVEAAKETLRKKP